MLLPPPATAAAVVVVGCCTVTGAWAIVVAGAVVIGFSGGVYDCWGGLDVIADAETMGELATAAEVLGDVALLVAVGMATGAVPAPDAVTSEGVA